MEQKRSVRETVRRYVLLIVSLFFSALGVAVTKHGALGVSPISSVANVMSYRVPALSLGSWLIVWNGLLILAQAAILRKRFRLYELLQIPVSLLFGYFTDFGTWCVSGLAAELYPVRWLFVAAGTMILGFGVALSVIANVVMNPGEALVRTVSDATHKSFGNVKIVLDVSYVVAALLLSLLFFGGKLVGVREGTVFAAVFTGVAVKFFVKALQEPLTKRWIEKQTGQSLL